MVRPLIETKVTPSEAKRGDGLGVISFIEEMCRSPKDTYAGKAGELIVLGTWQRRIIERLFARRVDGRRKHRVALIGMPRKNGKSGIGSGIALHGLFLGPRGAEVYACAADKDQAKIVFGVAKAMVEADPDLSAESKVYRDAIEVPAAGSVFRVLSSEAFTKEGLSPTLVVYDELHAAPNDELWHVMNLGSGARVDPLILAITTAGKRGDTTGQDSTCYRLWQHGAKVAAGEVKDPSFYMAWWGAPEGADHTNRAVWRRANPGLGVIVDPEDFESAVRRIPENEFRTKRLNQWVSSATAWLPAGAWEKCESDRRVPDGARVVVMFDGSYNRDATALVAATVAETPHVFTLGVWERPPDAPDEWTVPRQEVETAVEEAMGRWRVVELGGDRSKWFDEFAGWEDRWGSPPVLDYPQHPKRMVDACAHVYGAVVEQRLTHDGHPTLARHLANAAVKETADGAHIKKESRHSPRKIDAAVAAVMAVERAAWHAAHHVPTAHVWTV